MSSRSCLSVEPTLRPLTREEIDRRIETASRALADSPAARHTEPGEGMQPRWITAAELVRRLRPFIVLN